MMRGIIRLAMIFGLILGFSLIIACADKDQGDAQALELGILNEDKDLSGFDLSESDQTSGVQTRINSKPPNPSTLNTAEFRFSCNAGPCTYRCQIDGLAWGRCKSPKTYTALANRVHTFKVWAINSSGQADHSPAKYTWTIGITSPDTNITANPPDPSNSSDASFSFDCTIAPCTFQCQLDGGGWADCPPPKDYTGLSDGAHTFEVIASDALGNPDPTAASYTWTIDTAPPDTTIDSKPSNPSTVKSASFSFSCTEAPCTYECQLDSGAWTTCSSPQDYTGLALGMHNFQVRALDAAKNTDPSPDTYDWEILDAWLPISPTDAPSARCAHTAVWTETEMIVWGGKYYDGSWHNLNTGGRYDPSTNSWTATSTDNAPSGRNSHRAVWTGTEMIVWGGIDTTGAYFNTGGRYNPSTNSWTETSTDNAPSLRCSHIAIWTGTEMTVWGGSYYDENSGNYYYYADGARYDPANNSWTATSTDNAPVARESHTAVWNANASEIIVWGGYYMDPSWNEYFYNDGGRYDPANNSWTATSTDNAPSARISHTAVWSGTEMIIWGGYYYDPSYNEYYYNDGGRYDPVNNSWTATSTDNAPSARNNHAAVWTGTEMIVWGGGDAGGYFNTGGRYKPSADSWTATTTTNAPSARILFTAIWTGTDMIIWGGYDGTYTNDGGRY